MKNKEYVTALSKSTGVDVGKIEAIIDILPQVITECGLNNSSIAIPRFGTFSCLKSDEYISIDDLSGKSFLNPPSVKLVFRPSVMLRKKVE